MNNDLHAFNVFDIQIPGVTKGPKAPRTVVASPGRMRIYKPEFFHSRGGLSPQGSQMNGEEPYFSFSSDDYIPDKALQDQESRIIYEKLKKNNKNLTYGKTGIQNSVKKQLRHHVRMLKDTKRQLQRSSPQQSDVSQSNVKSLRKIYKPISTTPTENKPIPPRERPVTSKENSRQRQTTIKHLRRHSHLNKILQDILKPDSGTMSPISFDQPPEMKQGLKTTTQLSQYDIGDQRISTSFRNLKTFMMIPENERRVKQQIDQQFDKLTRAFMKRKKMLESQISHRKPFGSPQRSIKNLVPKSKANQQLAGKAIKSGKKISRNKSEAAFKHIKSQERLLSSQSFGRSYNQMRKLKSYRYSKLPSKDIIAVPDLIKYHIQEKEPVVNGMFSTSIEVTQTNSVGQMSPKLCTPQESTSPLNQQEDTDFNFSHGTHLQIQETNVPLPKIENIRHPVPISSTPVPTQQQPNSQLSFVLGPGNGLPNGTDYKFFSNHIQNLVINAPNGFSISDYLSLQHQNIQNDVQNSTSPEQSPSSVSQNNLQTPSDKQVPQQVSSLTTIIQHPSSSDQQTCGSNPQPASPLNSAATPYSPEPLLQIPSSLIQSKPIPERPLPSEESSVEATANVDALKQKLKETRHLRVTAQAQVVKQPPQYRTPQAGNTQICKTQQEHTFIKHHAKAEERSSILVSESVTPSSMIMPSKDLNLSLQHQGQNRSKQRVAELSQSPDRLNRPKVNDQSSPERSEQTVVQKLPYMIGLSGSKVICSESLKSQSAGLETEEHNNLEEYEKEPSSITLSQPSNLLEKREMSQNELTLNYVLGKNGESSEKVQIKKVGKAVFEQTFLVKQQADNELKLHLAISQTEQRQVQSQNVTKRGLSEQEPNVFYSSKKGGLSEAFDQYSNSQSRSIPDRGNFLKSLIDIQQFDAKNTQERRFLTKGSKTLSQMQPEFERTNLDMKRDQVEIQETYGYLEKKEIRSQRLWAFLRHILGYNKFRERKAQTKGQISPMIDIKDCDKQSSEVITLITQYWFALTALKRKGIKVPPIRLLKSKDKKVLKLGDLNLMKILIDQRNRVAYVDSNSEESVETVLIGSTANYWQFLNKSILNSTKNDENLIMIDKYNVSNFEYDCLHAFKKQPNQQNIELVVFAKRRNYKNKISMREHLQVTMTHTVFDDLAWKNKNENSNFIHLQEPHLLDKLTENVGLFSVKGYVQAENVESDINWNLVEDTIQIFEQKIQMFKAKQQNLRMCSIINKFVRSHFPLVPRVQADLQMIFKGIQLKYRINQRLIPYKLTSKVCKANHDLFRWCKVRFDSSYESLLDFPLSLSMKMVDNHDDIIRYKQSLTTMFKNSQAYLILASKYYINLNRIIFREVCHNVVFQLYKRKEVIMFYQRTGQLLQLLMKAYSKIVYSSMFRKDLIKVKPVEQLERAKTLTRGVTNQQYEKACLISYNPNLRIKKNKNNNKEFDKHEVNSMVDYVDDMFQDEALKLKRMNALDTYDKNYRDYVIHKHMMPLDYRVKDKVNLFYQRVETLIDSKDADYSETIRYNFGFKCSLIRNPYNINLIFEVYMPVLIEKAQFKIDNYELFMRATRSHKEKLGYQITAKNISMVSPNILAMRRGINEFFIENSFGTDSDMQDIYVSDIASELSYCKDTKSDAVSPNLRRSTLQRNIKINQVVNQVQDKVKSFVKKSLKRAVSTVYSESSKKLNQYNLSLTFTQAAHDALSSNKKLKLYEVITDDKVRANLNSSKFQVLQAENVAQHVKIDVVRDNVKKQKQDFFKNYEYINKVKNACYNFERDVSSSSISSEMNDSQDIQKKFVSPTQRKRRLVIFSPSNQQTQVLSKINITQRSLEVSPGSQNNEHSSQSDDKGSNYVQIGSPFFKNNGSRNMPNQESGSTTEFHNAMDKLSPVMRQYYQPVIEKHLSREKSGGDFWDRKQHFKQNLISRESEEIVSPGMSKSSQSRLKNMKDGSLLKIKNQNTMTFNKLPKFKSSYERKKTYQALSKDLLSKDLIDINDNNKSDSEESAGTVDNFLEGNEVKLLQRFEQLEENDRDELKKRLRKKIALMKLLSKIEDGKSAKQIEWEEKYVPKNKNQEQLLLDKRIRIGKTLLKIQNKIGIDIGITSQLNKLENVKHKYKRQLSLTPVDNREKQQQIQRQLFFNVLDRNCTRVSEMLDRFQIDTDITDSEGNNLIIISTMVEDFTTTKLLIRKGFNVNHQNNEGNTALHYAISGKSSNIINLLISYGANEFIENKNGQTCWQLAD